MFIASEEYGADWVNYVLPFKSPMQWLGGFRAWELHE
jgi:hypothetical protein